MTLKLTTVVLASILLCACASKKEKPFPSDQSSVTSLMPGGALLIGFNRNDDYEIDQDEFDQGRVKAFEVADRDGDNVITLPEFKAWHEKAIGARSARPNIVYFDRNFNDRVTKNEFNKGLKNLFLDADKDKSNSVTYQELVSIVAAPEQRRSRGSGGRGGGGERRGGGGGRGN